MLLNSCSEPCLSRGVRCESDCPSILYKEQEIDIVKGVESSRAGYLDHEGKVSFLVRKEGENHRRRESFASLF